MEEHIELEQADRAAQVSNARSNDHLPASELGKRFLNFLAASIVSALNGKIWSRHLSRNAALTVRDQLLASEIGERETANGNIEPSRIQNDREESRPWARHLHWSEVDLRAIMNKRKTARQLAAELGRTYRGVTRCGPGSAYAGSWRGTNP